MKKWLIGLSAIVVLSVLSIYIFIPRNLIIAKDVFVNCSESAAYRHLSEEDKWKNWWPQNDPNFNSHLTDTNHSFVNNNYSYRMISKMPDAVDVVIENNNSNNASTIFITPLKGDSLAITWQCNLTGSLNPVKRILQYQQAVEIKNNMTDILSHLQKFLEKKENIYKISIEQIIIKDTSLVSIKTSFGTYPTVQTVYSLINKIRNYINAEGAKETNYPMLNITKSDSAHFEIRVAIPVNKDMKGGDDIFLKKMVPGNVLVTEVKGGPSSINWATKQLESYIRDYHKTIIAIPFQALVTDRINEPDTSKWVTKIYYPIIQ